MKHVEDVTKIIPQHVYFTYVSYTTLNIIVFIIYC